MARSERRSYCRICPNACGVVLTVDGERVLAARGDREHPRTKGYLCPKGRALPAWHHHPDRLDHPHRRIDGALAPVGWGDCLDHLAGELTRVRDTWGAPAIAVYRGMSAYSDTLGQPVAAGLFDALESPSRYSVWTLDLPCAAYVAGLITGHPLLWPAPDEAASLVVLIGSNPMLSHGHAFSLDVPRSTLRAWARQGEVWVIDPRRTATAEAATRHLAPRPGSDYALLAYLVRELLRDGADEEYLARQASGVDALRAAVEPFDLARAAACTDLPEGEIVDLLDAIRRAGRVAVHTGTGVTMSAAANVATWLVWALNIVTGSHDRPGGNRFDPGAMDAFSAAARRGAGGPPSRPELPRFIMDEYPCAALCDEIESGNVRALLVVSGNPLTAFPNPDRLRRALARLEVLAVADVVQTPTAQLATHVLACAGQLERADCLVGGTIGTAVEYSPAVVAAAAERRPMWWVFAELGRRLGLDLLPGGVDGATATDEDLVERRATAFDVDVEVVRRERHLPPRPPVYGWVQERLPAGRWQLAPPELVDQLATLVDPGPGLVLIPARAKHSFNSVLADGAGRERRERPRLAMHPSDAASVGVRDGEETRVSSAHGSVCAVAHLDVRIRRGAVSLSHGYADANVNHLTSEQVEVDRYTGMVRLSGVPVDVTPTDQARAR